MVREIKEISEAEARIHANICGDGWIFSYKRKPSPSDVKARPNITQKLVCSINYCNTEPKLLDRFSFDVKLVYGLRTTAWKIYRRIIGKWVYDRLKLLGAGKSKEWFISDEIMCADINIICEWLKAFFDDEGHVDVKTGYITLNSVNLSGLMQVQELLKKVGIENTSIKGPYYYQEFFHYRLKILSSGLEKFNQAVGFYHPKKAVELAKLLALRAEKLKTKRAQTS